MGEAKFPKKSNTSKKINNEDENQNSGPSFFCTNTFSMIICSHFFQDYFLLIKKLPFANVLQNKRS